MAKKFVVSLPNSLAAQVEELSDEAGMLPTEFIREFVRAGVEEEAPIEIDGEEVDPADILVDGDGNSYFIERAREHKSGGMTVKLWPLEDEEPGEDEPEGEEEEAEEEEESEESDEDQDEEPEAE